MKIKDLQIFAMAETLLIWDRLAETADGNKSRVLISLYYEDKLTQIEYNWGCPLCEYLRTVPGRPECSCCPIPGEGRVRCDQPGSLYWKWRTSGSKGRPARQFFNYLSKVDF